MNYTAMLRAAQDSLRLQPGARELGHLLWWTLGSTRINHAALVASAERHGLDPRFIPPEVKPVQAFRRAWRHATSRLPAGLMLRPVAETSDVIVVGIVREQPDAARREIDYELIGRIVFNKLTDTITADVEHDLAVQVRLLFAHHRAHTSEDIRSMLTSFVAHAGVSLRESGGVYFVPAAHGPQLESLCCVIEDVGHNKAFRLPIIDSPATQATLREVATPTFDEEVRALVDGHQDPRNFGHEAADLSGARRAIRSMRRGSACAGRAASWPLLLGLV